MNFQEFKVKTQALSVDPDFARVLEKHGFKLGHPTRSVGGMFGADKVTLKVAVVDADPKARKEVAESKLSEKAEAFKVHAEMVGLKPSHLNEVITLKNKRFKITGFNVGKPKNCINMTEIATGRDGWMCPAETAISALKRAGKF